MDHTNADAYGLNLQAANHVIHYDRWWNPATERQATDRVHRIGQGKTVWVYLPIAKDTAEERLDELLTRKQVVADSVIEGLRDLSLTIWRTCWRSTIRGRG